MIISSNIQPQEWRLINMSMTELEQHYNKFNEEKRLDSRHGQVEYITSMKYIHKYLDKLKEESESDEKPIRILDIGAGTGRYSVPLANEGYDVSAVELVKHNLGLLKAKNSPAAGRPLSLISSSSLRAIRRPSLIWKLLSICGSLISPFQPTVVRGFSK